MKHRRENSCPDFGSQKKSNGQNATSGSGVGRSSCTCSPLILIIIIISTAGIMQMFAVNVHQNFDDFVVISTTCCNNIIGDLLLSITFHQRKQYHSFLMLK